METILGVFDLQVALILVAKFSVSWLFPAVEDVQITFSRWQPLRPFLISDRNDLFFFFFFFFFF